jgi:hypothetical protein
VPTTLSLRTAPRPRAPSPPLAGSLIAPEFPNRERAFDTRNFFCALLRLPTPLLNCLWSVVSSPYPCFLPPTVQLHHVPTQLPYAGGAMISAPSAGGCFRKGPLPWRLRPRPRSCLVSPPASGGGETEFVPEFQCSLLESLSLFLSLVKEMRVCCRKGRHLLVERYRDGVTKRFLHF